MEVMRVRNDQMKNYDRLYESQCWHTNNIRKKAPGPVQLHSRARARISKRAEPEAERSPEPNFFIRAKPGARAENFDFPKAICKN